MSIASFAKDITELREMEKARRQEQEAVIAAQAQSLMELSTPVTEVWPGVLLLPIVGMVDSKRAQDIISSALSKISESQARLFVMDISGVPVVDTAVANYLIKVTKATRLMGCESIISGISPAIAQTMVALDIGIGTIKTTASLNDALAHALMRLGLTVGAKG